MKYSEQMRLCCDVASVMKDGTEEGRQCLSFDYPGRNEVTITVLDKMIKDEIARVKILPGTGGGWVGGGWKGLACNKTKQIMTNTSHIKHWILPLKDLNAGTIYRKRPSGDSPEFMPLDTSLFNDAHQGM
jgi:hypothetical protein